MRSGSTTLLFQSPGEISAVGCEPVDHFLAGIVKTQTFQIYLFIRSSSDFANLDCVNWERDGPWQDSSSLPGRVGWGIASEPTGIACGRR